MDKTHSLDSFVLIKSKLMEALGYRQGWKTFLLKRQHSPKTILELGGYLSDKQRRVIILVYVKKLTIAEIAVELNISENMAKIQMLHARTNLKNILLSRASSKSH